MTLYIFTVYVNEGPTRMWEYKKGDPLREVMDGVDVEADSIEEALEVVWELGNKEGARAGEYPTTERSLCMGDVAYAWGGARGQDVPEDGAYWVVEAMGWSQLPEPRPFFNPADHQKHHAHA